MFEQPLVLFALPVALFILYWLIRKRFVPDTYVQASDAMRQRRLRVLLVLTRTLVFAAVIVALAQPFIEGEQFTVTHPELLVLVDESASMGVLDTAGVESLIDSLQRQAPVRVRTIGQEMQSSLGDDTLSHIGRGENVLLITDGHVTQGASLSDVALFASSLNATVNAISLDVSERDTAVRIEGPEKAVEGVESTVDVVLSKTHDDPVPLRVTLDGEVVFEEETRDTRLSFAQSFDVGQYRVVAEVLEEDYFAQNNRYTHTLTVVDRPRIAYVSQKQSGLETILNELYSVDTFTSIPQDLEPYYAVVLNDLPANRISDQRALQEFLTQGGGLFVVGGEQSYESGNYRGSVLETLLPVRVGTGIPARGGANIVVAIDMSGSTFGSVEWTTTATGQRQFIESTQEVQSLQRALAISLISELNPSNQLGVLGFTFPMPHSPTGCSGACVVHEVAPIGQTKPEINDKVARVNITGGTNLVVGLEGAWRMLEQSSGSRNIIFISNVVGSSPQDREQALVVARRIAQQGGSIYAVQVGDSEMGTDFMRRLAREGAGTYFRATQANRLTALFGEPVDIDQGDAFDVFVLDQHHFITQDLDISATVYGYNQVVPKPGSRLLLTSIGGDPALTVWNFGVGRVAALTAFDGSDLGSLLTAPSSRVLSRTTNWLIGDPERKNDVVVDVPDAFVFEQATAVVSASTAPSADGMSFSSLGGGRYAASFTPEEVGVFSVLGAEYAVNYPREFQRVGMSERLEDQLAVGGGRVFSPDQVDQIVDHVKTQQSMIRSERVPLSWHLLLFAIVLFVLEVVVRRMWLRR